MKYLITLLSIALLFSFCGAQSLNSNRESAIDDYNKGKNVISSTRRENVLWEEAIRHFNKAIEKDTCFADAYYLRGASYQQIGKHKEALNDLNKAIEYGQKDTTYYKYYFKRAFIYDALGDKRKEIQDFTQCMELNPNYIRAYCNRGLTYEELGIRDSALIDIKKALSLDSTDAIALKHLKLWDKREQAKIKKQFVNIENTVKLKGSRLRGAIWYLIEIEDLGKVLLLDRSFTQRRYDNLVAKLRKRVDADIKRLALYSVGLQVCREMSWNDFIDIYRIYATPRVVDYNSAPTLEYAIELMMRDRVFAGKISREESERPYAVDRNGYNLFRNCIVNIYGKELWRALDGTCFPQ